MPQGEKSLWEETRDYWKEAFKNAGERTRDFIRETRDGLDRLVNGPRDP